MSGTEKVREELGQRKIVPKIVCYVASPDYLQTCEQHPIQVIYYKEGHLNLSVREKTQSKNGEPLPTNQVANALSSRWQALDNKNATVKKWRQGNS